MNTCGRERLPRVPRQVRVIRRYELAAKDNARCRFIGIERICSRDDNVAAQQPGAFQLAQYPRGNSRQAVEAECTVDWGHGIKAFARAVHALAELLASRVVVSFLLDQRWGFAAKGSTDAMELLLDVFAPFDGCNLQRPPCGRDLSWRAARHRRPVARR